MTFPPKNSKKYWRPRNLSTGRMRHRPKRETGYWQGRDEGWATISHNRDLPHLLGQKAASEETIKRERERENKISKLKGMREGVKEQASHLWSLSYSQALIQIIVASRDHETDSSSQATPKSLILRKWGTINNCCCSKTVRFGFICYTRIDH